MQDKPLPLTTRKLRGLPVHRREQIQTLKAKGWSKSFIARAIGLHRETVAKYWDDLHLEPTPTKRWLDQYQNEVYDLYAKCQNCAVIKRKMWENHRLKIALRTVQEWINIHRPKILDTAGMDKILGRHKVDHYPGEFMQIDYGFKKMVIGKETVPVHFFVAALPYSKRFFILVTADETQDNWLRGCEAAFRYFGAKPKFIVCDNAKALVRVPAATNSKKVVFTERFNNFCDYWRVSPIACHPYYPQAKGFVERMVGYIKHNALNGTDKFDSLANLQDWLENYWLPKIADMRLPNKRVRPIEAFTKEEKPRMLPLGDQPDFLDCREFFRKVSAKATLQIENQVYRLPAYLAKNQVRAVMKNNKIAVYYRGDLVKTLDAEKDTIKPIQVEPSESVASIKFGATDQERFAYVINAEDYSC